VVSDAHPQIGSAVFGAEEQNNYVIMCNIKRLLATDWH